MTKYLLATIAFLAFASNQVVSQEEMYYDQPEVQVAQGGGGGGTYVVPETTYVYQPVSLDSVEYKESTTLSTSLSAAILSDEVVRYNDTVAVSATTTPSLTNTAVYGTVQAAGGSIPVKAFGKVYNVPTNTPTPQ